MGTKFECSLCLDDFKDPRILVCFHTFCRNCLEDYLTNTVGSNLSGVTFECPLCRSKTTLSSDGVDGIQKNFYLDQEDQKPGPQICSFHPKEDLRFYCRNCKTPVCRDCKVVSHEGHTTDMVSEIITEIKQKLDDHLNATEKTINENEVKAYTSVTTEIEAVEKTMAHLKGKALGTKQEIDSLLGIIISVFQTHWGKRKQKKLAMAKTFEEKRTKLNEYQNSLSHAVDQGDLNTLFRLADEVLDNGDEIFRLKQLPHGYASSSSCADGFDDSDLRLETQFVQLTEKIHNCIKEFRESGPVQEVFESFYKRTWTLRASTSRDSEADVIPDASANGIQGDIPQEDTSNYSIQADRRAPKKTDSERKPYQDPDVIAVCHLCGTSSQNRPNCAACGERFNLYTAYYSKDHTDTKRQKVNDTPQTSTLEDNDEDCVVTSADFPNQTDMKKTEARSTKRKTVRGSGHMDKINKRKRTQRTGIHIPVSTSVYSTNPYVPADVYMQLATGSRDPDEKQDAWNCTTCTLSNRQERENCICCDTPRPAAGKSDVGAKTSLRGPVGFEHIDASVSYKPDPSHPYQPGHSYTDQSDPPTSSAVTPIDNSIWCPYPETTLSQNHPSTPLVGDVKTTMPRVAHIQESKQYSNPYTSSNTSISGMGTASPRMAHSQEPNPYLKSFATPTVLNSSVGTTGPWMAHSQESKPYINQFASPSNTSTFSSSTGTTIPRAAHIKESQPYIEFVPPSIALSPPTGTAMPRAAHIQESKPYLQPFAPSNALCSMAGTTAPSVAYIPESNICLQSAATNIDLNSPIGRSAYMPQATSVATPYAFDSPAGTPGPRVAHRQNSHSYSASINFPSDVAALRIAHNQDTNPDPNSVTPPYHSTHVPVDLRQPNTIQGTNSDWDVLNKIWEKP